MRGAHVDGERSIAACLSKGLTWQQLSGSLASPPSRVTFFWVPLLVTKPQFLDRLKSATPSKPQHPNYNHKTTAAEPKLQPQNPNYNDKIQTLWSQNPSTIIWPKLQFYNLKYSHAIRTKVPSQGKPALGCPTNTGMPHQDWESPPALGIPASTGKPLKHWEENPEP